MPDSEACPPEQDPAVLSALYLGRIQAAVSQANDGAMCVLAGRLIRESLVTALRQEGHSFTDERFFDWFAGLSTLSDVSAHKLRPPRALCQAILTEFRHNPWSHLAEASERMARAFLAPVDLERNEGHEDTNALLAEARLVVDAIEPCDTDLPFTPVSALFSAARKSLRFARQERGIELIKGPRSAVAVEVNEQTHSRWALDILSGNYLAPKHGLPISAPLPGLLTFATEHNDPFDDDMPSIARPSGSNRESLIALRDALWSLDRRLLDAIRDAHCIADKLQNRRSNGRAGDVAFYLAGFGILRGVQIERVIGASRLGVRTIMSTLVQAGLVEGETSRNAATMFRFAPREVNHPHAAQDPEDFAFSSQAIDEFQSSMDAIDELLRRTSRSQSEDGC
ncbi:hypothetical protein SAMN06295987_103203 [Novosphingobium mathurense]|uniref:Uncharacterized protein n=1 Tax=Novosphingobium mathurense TaxID=428990 RepID=A0A1U6HVW3_9SPHN|nr:hypothetical protein SAMN06295987_103203 [Novosphingobium mathurense]